MAPFIEHIKSCIAPCSFLSSCGVMGHMYPIHEDKCTTRMSEGAGARAEQNLGHDGSGKERVFSGRGHLVSQRGAQLETRDMMTHFA